MSFGFSVGDFLTVIGLVTQLRKDFADAPSQLRDLSAELKTFSILLQDAEVDLGANEVDSRQLETLESTLSSARDFLKDLQKFIDDNKEVPKSTGSKARVSLRRIWKRLNFDQQEVSKFRHQIISIISGLQLFTSNEVKRNTRKIARYVDKQEHRDILKWISDDDYSYHKNYKIHLVRNRQAGTRKWLLESDEWKSWLKSGGQTLYCPGIPGSGKTFTTAMVIENLESLSEQHGWILAYVFCNYQRRREDIYEMLLRSLLRMMLEQTQEMPDEIQHWSTRKQEIRIDEIMEQLCVLIKGCSRVFLVVDALDELEACQDFVSRLFDLQKAVGVNLYFTSRKIPHIQVIFDNAMIVPIKATEHDVGMYLDDQMRMPNVPNFVRINTALQDEIKKTIVSAVGEMFLLAELQVKQLMQSKSTRRLQNALKAIASGRSTYETAYQNAMDRIQSQDKRTCELATNAISILAYAERPLLAPELVHALSVDLDFDESSDSEHHKITDLQSMSDSLGVFDPDLMPTIEDVLAASAGLIVYQPDSGTVRLVHKTTREYLMSDDGRQKWFPRAQLTIAAICLIYTQASGDSNDNAAWPFLDYAQKHYGHHIMAQESLERVQQPATVQASHYKSAPGSNISVPQTQQLIDQIGLARMARDLGGIEDVLILACERNQLNFARVLLSTGQYTRPSEDSDEDSDEEPEATVTNPSSPYNFANCAIDRALVAAVGGGHLELVDLLLQYYGANPMVHGLEGSGLLASASSGGHHNVVSYFLEHEYYTMAMMQHDKDGFPLVKSSAAEPRNFSVRSPVCHAAFSGSILCVKILLKWIGIHADGSRRDAEQERILENVTLSAIAGSQALVLEILPRLSSTNISNMLHVLGDPNLLFTSIRWAVSLDERDRSNVAEFFLRSYSFDFSHLNASGANALICAAESGIPEVVRLILEERSDLLNSQDSSGRTPLSWAAEKSYKCVQVLVGYKGVQLELVDNAGLAPIDYMLRTKTHIQPHFDPGGWYRGLPVLIPVLERGINTLDRHGCTILHILIDKFYPRRREDRARIIHMHWEKLERYEGRRIFECREEWDNDVYSRITFQARGLQIALGTVPVSITQIRSSTCKCGIGTIFLAISTQSVDMVKVLLDLYPDLVNDQFYDGSSPLDLASCIPDQHRRQSMIGLILSKNPIVKTYKSDTATSQVCKSASGETKKDGHFVDLELHHRQETHVRDETDEE